MSHEMVCVTLNIWGIRVAGPDPSRVVYHPVRNGRSTPNGYRVLETPDVTITAFLKGGVLKFHVKLRGRHNAVSLVRVPGGVEIHLKTRVPSRAIALGVPRPQAA